MTDTPAPLIREQVPLAQFSTIGIGGPARYFAEPETEEQLLESMRWAAAPGIPLFVLGGGSNVVFSDEGFPGLVIHLRLRGVHLQNDGDTWMIVAKSGETWEDVVRIAVDHRLGGVECLAGIPGQVGATPIQNVGAYGQEVSDTIGTVEAIERSTGEKRIFRGEECQFGYRTSRFKTTDRDRYIITAVSFRLARDAKPSVKYAELERHLGEHHDGEAPSLAAVREAVLAIRRRKAMVVDPAEPNSRSCGSFFTNPIVMQAEFERVKQVAAADGIPSYPADEGHVKLSAAWLMEHSGLTRGMRHGNVGLSERHVLAIVNFGGGSSREVLQLAQMIQQRVMDTFGVRLEPEPVLVGQTTAQ